jgi:hypothetical protein
MKFRKTTWLMLATAFLAAPLAAHADDRGRGRGRGGGGGGSGRGVTQRLRERGPSRAQSAPRAPRAHSQPSALRSLGSSGPSWTNRASNRSMPSPRSFDLGNRGSSAEAFRRTIPRANGLTNPAFGNRGLTNRGVDGDALARYRAAISQSQGRSRSALRANRPSANLPTNPTPSLEALRNRSGGGDSAWRARIGNASERLRARTSASTPGEGSALRAARGDSSSVTHRSSALRSRFGAGAVGGGLDSVRAGSTTRSRLLERGGSGGLASERLRLRREGGDSASARTRLSARAGFSGGGGDAVGTRYIRRHDHHDHHGHHHGHHGHHGFHDWFGYVHHHHHGGFFVSWWNPWHYSHYNDFWVGGLPAFGFGVAYYEPVYAPYFEPGVVVLEPAPVVVQQQPVVVGGVPAPVYGPGQGVGPGQGAVPSAPLLPTQPAAPADGAVLPSADENDAAKQAFETGFRAFSEQRYEQALGMFRLVVELDPKNGEAWLGRAHAAFAISNYREAAESVARAADLGAFPRGYRFDPRPVYRTPGTFDDAFARLKEYARTNPQDADAHVLLAWLHVGLGERDQAQASLASLRALRADDPTAAFLRVAMLPPEPPASAEEDAAGVPVRPPAPDYDAPPEGELPPPVAVPPGVQSAPR